MPDTNDGTGGLQTAIDAVGPSGGVVQLPPGEYRLRRSVRLPSRVILRGSGPATRIVLEPERATSVVEPVREGDERVRVADAAGFEAGMQVSIAQQLWYGWQDDGGHAIITRVEGDRLHLDEPLPADLDLSTRTEVVNLFPGILVDGAADAAVENLVLDGGCTDLAAARQSVDFATSGQVPEDLGPFCGFPCAAVHAVGCSGLRLSRVTAVRWPSDGFSVQKADGALIEGCQAAHCRGAGFHPGQGSRHVRMSGCVGHHNAWDGLYLCHNVAYGTFTGNVLHDNGHFGIGGIGWRDEPAASDQGNTLTGNVCEGNGWAGIQVVKGNRNVLSGNVCRSNSRSEPGRWPGILLEGAAHMVVTGNLGYDDAIDRDESPTQGWGIEERDSWDGVVRSEGNRLEANVCHGHVHGDVTRAAPQG